MRPALIASGIAWAISTIALTLIGVEKDAGSWGILTGLVIGAVVLLGTYVGNTRWMTTHSEWRIPIITATASTAVGVAATVITAAYFC